MSRFLEYRQRMTDDVGCVVLLRVECAAFPEPMLAVNDTRNWTLNGEEYLALPFGFKLPEDVQGSAARAKLVMDNVGRGISDYLERVGPQDVVLCTFMLCNREEPLVVAHSVSLPMTNVSISGVIATADCGADALMRQQAVKIRQYPHITPGEFVG